MELKKKKEKKPVQSGTPQKLYSEAVLERIRQCGKVSLPLLDTCRLAGISIDDFSGSKELMNTYRSAQIETSLEIRTKLLEGIEKYPDPKLVKLYVEKFLGEVLPDPDEMEEM